MLKITAYQKDGSLFSSRYNNEDSIPTSEYFSGEWFLHGELQCFVGFDKGIATNCEELGIAADMPNFAEIKDSNVVSIFDRTPMRRMKLSGIIPVEVEGIDRPCTGYFWLEDETEIKWEGRKYPDNSELPATTNIKRTYIGKCPECGKVGVIVELTDGGTWCHNCE